MKKHEEPAPVPSATETPSAAPIPPAGASAPETAPLTPEQLADLEARAAKAQEHWDRLLRATADFENFKKRAQREKQEAIRYANESLLEKIMPILDAFEKATSAAQTAGPGDLKALREGVAMIHAQLKNTLTEAGLEEVDAAGKPFDPTVHEAISQQDSETVADGHVLQQLRKGYKLRERLLRPAMVIVAKHPEVKA
ncbi:MAG: nucleotide exchange factor GrpE [Verrucomicrobiae bacterium]|nr:nucleotide exchange factor GrpE [Verrucomicrobiae bacterium]